MRPDGTQDVVFVKDIRDKGTVIGQGYSVTQLPRKGGCVFVTSGSNAKLTAFDGDGKKITEFAKAGYEKIGRPAIDPTGTAIIAEFIGEFESEIWRIPLLGKSAPILVTSINKGTGTASPAYEMDSKSIWIKMGSAWSLFDVASSTTSPANFKPLLSGLPSGANVTEVRPSHSVPKLVAVTVEVASSPKTSWVMIWDRQTDQVSRLNPIGTNADTVDWSRDGRYVLFMATDTTSGRISFQAANPVGGDPQVISVIKDAGQ